jgi:hypothetical protein
MCYETEKALNSHRTCAPATHLTLLPDFPMRFIVLSNANCAHKSLLLLPTIGSLIRRNSAINDTDFRAVFLSTIHRWFASSVWNLECAFKVEPRQEKMETPCCRESMARTTTQRENPHMSEENMTAIHGAGENDCLWAWN